MVKEEYKRYNCSMCGFMVRAKTNEEILDMQNIMRLTHMPFMKYRLRWPGRS